MPLRGIVASGIWTGDPLRRWVSSVAFEGDRVAGAGEALRVGASDVLHAPQGWVLPGLIDAHLHLLMGGLSLSQLDLAGCCSRDEFEAAIAARHRELPPGVWLEASGWNEAQWGGGRPDRHWLRSAHDRPVVAWRCDRHVALVNGAALAQLDLSHEVPGGTIECAADGSPTGLFLEQAAWKLVIPAVPTPLTETKRAALARATAHLHALGVTSVGAMEYIDDLDEILAPAARTASLGLRVIATVLDRDRPLPFERARALGASDAFGIRGFKSFADGTLGASTAAVFEAYADGTGRGELIEHAARGELAAWMREVLDAGFSPSVHAIGDRALAAVLAAALTEDRAKRVRFEHAQTVDPDSLPRFAGRIVSMQPFHKATDAALALTRLGAHRENRFFRFRDFLRAGARLAFGSDWPISSADPLEGMRTAITGLALDGRIHGPSQTLTAVEAIDAYTVGAADCLGASDRLGRLSPGYFADAVILDRDPLSCDWLNDAPQVLATIVGGELRYDALGKFSATCPTDHAVKS